MLFSFNQMTESGRFFRNTEPIGQHYSEKGGHWARSNHWKFVRKGELNPQGMPIVQQQDNRRMMRRIPRSGR